MTIAEVPKQAVTKVSLVFVQPWYRAASVIGAMMQRGGWLSELMLARKVVGDLGI